MAWIYSPSNVCIFHSFQRPYMKQGAVIHISPLLSLPKLLQEANIAVTELAITQVPPNKHNSRSNNSSTPSQWDNQGEDHPHSLLDLHINQQSTTFGGSLNTPKQRSAEFTKNQWLYTNPIILISLNAYKVTTFYLIHPFSFPQNLLDREY